MKKISILIFLSISLSCPLWANNESYIYGEELEQTHGRTWTVAISTWPEFNAFISKDFFAEDSGLGLSTTSRINFAYGVESSVYSSLQPITFEQTGNIDLLIGWFHFQIQLGPTYSIYQVESEGSHTWKKSVGMVGGTNLIISDRAALSLLVRSMDIPEQETIASMGLYLGWRF